MSSVSPTNTFVYSVDRDRQFVGWRAHHILSLSALDWDVGLYIEEYKHRLVEFLTYLTNPGDERFTYDLRVISDPDPESFSRGKITVVLLARVLELGREEADAYARQMLLLLNTIFPEYEFGLVPAGDLRKLFQPFPVKHLALITRRAELRFLDTLRSGRRRVRVGFTPSDLPRSDATSPKSNVILHYFPYLPTWSPFNILFELFLQQGHPFAISTRIRPTSLRPEEESFLEDQISQCERYIQMTLERTPEDLSLFFPPLRDYANFYKESLTHALFGLKDNAAMITTQIAGPKRIPIPLLDVVGGLLSQPAGGIQPRTQATTPDYFSGGFEILDRSGNLSALDTFQQLEMDIPRHPLAGAGAERLLYLFDTFEAASVFRLPPATLEDPLGLEVRHWRVRRAPRQLPQKGCLLGATVSTSSSQEIRLAPEDRSRHVYVVGQTGTGKTTMLETMILEDMRSGRGLCLVDPHGDLFKQLMDKVPAERQDDVVVLDPTDTDFPVGLNMLECETEVQRYFLVQELVSIVTRLIEDQYGARATGEFAGPMFFQHMRMNLLLAMSDPDDPGTLLEFYNIYQEPNFWRRWLPLKVSDHLLDRWVAHVLPRTDYTRQGSDSFSMGGYIGSKFEGFLFDPLLRNIFAAKHSTMDFRTLMDEGKILLVNLAKGVLSEENSRFFGMVLMAKLMSTAMSRVKIPEAQRREFILYVDEFQSLATQSFVTLLSEARKFGLSLVLANQFLSQVKDPRIVQGIFGNVGTLVCFRLGQADADLMEKEFWPTFKQSDFVHLPNWTACIKALVHGQTTPPFTLSTVLDSTPPDENAASAILCHSRQKYARPRAQAEWEVLESLRSGPADAPNQDSN